MKILAVDDDQHFLDLLVAVLNDGGYLDVVCAGSAEEALTLADLTHVDFDCFLLDVAMPDIDGVQLCEELRATKRYRWFRNALMRVPRISSTNHWTGSNWARGSGWRACSMTA